MRAWTKSSTVVVTVNGRSVVETAGRYLLCATCYALLGMLPCFQDAVLTVDFVVPTLMVMKSTFSSPDSAGDGRNQPEPLRRKIDWFALLIAVGTLLAGIGAMIAALRQ